MQWCYYVDLCGLVKFCQYGLVEIFVQIVDWCLVDFVVMVVDVGDQFGDFVLEVVVGFDCVV